jgi:soluble lytic murein transglycosylase-like protein
VLPLLLLGVAGVVAAAVGLTGHPNLVRAATALRLPLPYVQSAAKWARKRGLPLDWVLTTILVESGGRPTAAGDSDGRSVGLMQVNTVAHAAELKAAGLSRESLFDPETNIEWGTKYLAAFRADVLQALGGRSAPAPLDELVRLSYKGPAAVTGALRRGQNPRTALSWAPEAITNWRQRRAQVLAALSPKLTA